MGKVSFAAMAAVLVLAAMPALGQSAITYDEDWYRAPFWSGEYPDGFTVLKDVTVQLRPTLDPKAERSIACELPARATYQPWNAGRVAEQGLVFVSFTRIGDYKIVKPLEASLYRSDDGTRATVSFEPGDTWRYLAYYAEGSFLIEHEGVKYDADQSLVDVSQQMGDAAGYEEWLRINCPNNRWGWLFMGDIQLDDAAYASPNIVEYGLSADLD